MKSSHIVAVLAVFLFSAISAQAEDEAGGRWELTYLNFNQGNVFISGSAVGDKLIVAAGVEVDGSSGNSMPTMKRSTDGVSFSPISLPPEAGFTLFTDIQMINPNLGFAAGNALQAGPIWRITNNGSSVESLVVVWGEFPKCVKLFCLDADHCWSTCNEGLMIRSSDSGENWDSSTLPVTDLNRPGPIHFINESVGYAMMGMVESQGEGENEVDVVQARGTTFKTVNGGESWTKLAEDEAYAYGELQFINENLGYVTAWDNTKAYLLKTENGGQSWNVLPVPPTMAGQFDPSAPLWQIGGVHFFDADRGWIVASYGSEEGGIGNVLTFLYTEDGGINWESHLGWGKDAEGNDVNVGGQMYDMAVVDEHLAYGFGEMQVVMRYTDGEYNPPDTDGDDPVDGDGVQPDGDGTVDGDTSTGPVYDGGPGQPCPVPGEDAEDSYPRCDPLQGSGLCVWRDDHDPYCSASCVSNEDCRVLDPDSCCKPVDFEGETKNICMLEDKYCVDYSGKWYGYEGALLGEPCRDVGHPDLPKCDKNYGGKFCVDEKRGGPTFCTMECTGATECPGGFQTEFCCSGEAGDMTYCRYGRNCDPDWDPTEDGDVNEPDGDLPAIDGDVSVDGDDSGSGGSRESDGGGCNAAAGGPLVLLAFSMLLLRRRRS